jgi:hypothetical protein
MYFAAGHSVREAATAGNFRRLAGLFASLGWSSGGNDYAAGLRNDAGDGDVGAGQRVDDLALAQARGVVLEGDGVGAFIMAEAAQAVSVGEFAEVGHLFGGERRLELEGDFHESHRWGL